MGTGWAQPERAVWVYPSVVPPSAGVAIGVERIVD